MSKRKSLTNEEFVKAFEKAFEGVNFDEQPAQQQEPAGSVYRYGKDSSGKQWHGIRWTASGLDLPDGTLVYTSPQASKPWVGLTDDEVWELWNSHAEQPFPDFFVDFKRSYGVIEAKLKEKNA
jgi:hypothetical protein